MYDFAESLDILNIQDAVAIDGMIKLIDQGCYPFEYFDCASYLYNNENVLGIRHLSKLFQYKDSPFLQLSSKKYFLDKCKELGVPYVPYCDGRIICKPDKAYGGNGVSLHTIPPQEGYIYQPYIEGMKVSSTHTLSSLRIIVRYTQKNTSIISWYVRYKHTSNVADNFGKINLANESAFK